VLHICHASLPSFAAGGGFGFAAVSACMASSVNAGCVRGQRHVPWLTWQEMLRVSPHAMF
jgi:hypothetical protein